MRSARLLVVCSLMSLAIYYGSDFQCQSKRLPDQKSTNITVLTRIQMKVGTTTKNWGQLHWSPFGDNEAAHQHIPTQVPTTRMRR